MGKPEKNDWLRILEVIRKTICPAGEPTDFSVDDLAKVVSSGPSSKPREMASGYLSSFRKWGFIKRVGKLSQSGPGRPTYTYRVTSYGYDFEALESQRELNERHIVRLTQAIDELRQADGDREEATAFKKLTRVHDEVLKEREEHEKKKNALTAKKEHGQESEFSDGVPPE